MRKILYSPRYGAGWTTWNGGEAAKYMLTYQPIIDALERGEKLDKDSPVVLQLEQECLDKFGQDICVLGADKLQVATVSGRVRIHEYDGNESYEEEGDYEGWM
jgi:hypothetical protein